MSSYVDSQGYRVHEDTVKAKFKGYCVTCQHTFWAGETVQRHKPKGFTHLDCLVALADRTPRKLNPKYLTRENEFTRFTGLDKVKLKKKAKKVLRKREGSTRPAGAAG